MSMTAAQRATHMKVVGATMAGATFIANFKGSVQVWVEARRSKGSLRPVQKPRIIMQSEMAPLIALGYLREEMDGKDLTVVTTGKPL